MGPIEYHVCSAGRGRRSWAIRHHRRGCRGFGTRVGCFRGNLTHHELGVLLRLGLEGLLAGGQPASGSGEGPARNVGSHCCSGGVGELESGEFGVAGLRGARRRWSCKLGCALIRSISSKPKLDGLAPDYVRWAGWGLANPRSWSLGHFKPPSPNAGKHSRQGCEGARTIFRLNVPAPVNPLLVADFLRFCYC